MRVQWLKCPRLMAKAAELGEAPAAASAALMQKTAAGKDDQLLDLDLAAAPPQMYVYMSMNYHYVTYVSYLYGMTRGAHSSAQTVMILMGT